MDDEAESNSDKQQTEHEQCSPKKTHVQFVYEQHSPEKTFTQLHDEMTNEIIIKAVACSNGTNYVSRRRWHVVMVQTMFHAILQRVKLL